jgi:hypothetical protein
MISDISYFTEEEQKFYELSLKFNEKVDEYLENLTKSHIFFDDYFNDNFLFDYYFNNYILLINKKKNGT